MLARAAAPADASRRVQTSSGGHTDPRRETAEWLRPGRVAPTQCQIRCYCVVSNRRHNQHVIRQVISLASSAEAAHAWELVWVPIGSGDASGHRRSASPRRWYHGWYAGPCAWGCGHPARACTAPAPPRAPRRGRPADLRSPATGCGGSRPVGRGGYGSGDGGLASRTSTPPARCQCTSTMYRAVQYSVVTAHTAVYTAVLYCSHARVLTSLGCPYYYVVVLHKPHGVALLSSFKIRRVRRRRSQFGPSRP